LPSDILARNVFECEEEDKHMLHCLLHDAINAGVSKNCFKLFHRAFPKGNIKQDNNVMFPLHHACATDLPSCHEYIKAFHDIHSGETLLPQFPDADVQLSVQDNQGRIPFQLLPANNLFILYDLTANSLNISESAVRLLVDILPKSIRTPNKYGMLPFHCAFLNPETSIEILMLLISLSPRRLLHLFSPVSIFQPRNAVARGKGSKATQERYF